MKATYKWLPRNPVTTRSDVTTHGIRVETQSFFSPERSSPHLHAFFFFYRIRISNESDSWAKLLRRHWHITDGNGMVQEVEGAGVVDEQPELVPGETFEYTSACPLSTRIGFMRGSYRMMHADKSEFNATIDEFGLVTPGTTN